jgi:hypothetical protein
MKDFKTLPIEELSRYYNGFHIEEPVGNNAFAYEQRADKRLFVAPLIEGTPEDLDVGEETAFGEFVGGREFQLKGLRRMIYMRRGRKQFFIFDNHNHAFFFWVWALKAGDWKPGTRLVHVDQHTDMRDPGILPVWKEGHYDLDNVFRYTNFHLNVGNFLKPALTLGMFRAIEMITSREAFTRSFPGPYVLDIDIDIFSDEMQYIDEDLKVRKIREYIEGSDVITIATSPYFMDQSRAIAVIRRTLEPWS